MKRIALLLLAGLLLFPIAFAACDDDQRIFRISSPTNAHAELWNGTGSYTEEICYNDFWGNYSGGSPHTCSVSNTVLWLFDTTNAHVEENGIVPQNYTEQVCFGDLQCAYAPAGQTCDSVLSGSQCVATISGSTNAHVAVCNDPSSYDTKVCCSSLSCTISGIDPDEIKVNDTTADGTTTVTVDYYAFSNAPTPGSLDCGDLGESSAISCLGGLPSGTCTFSCSNYKQLGPFSISVSLFDGVPEISCGASVGTFILVFGTIVRLQPPADDSLPFTEAAADVTVSSTGKINLEEETQDSESTAHFQALSMEVYIDVKLHELDAPEGNQISIPFQHVSPKQVIEYNDPTDHSKKSVTFDFLGEINDITPLPAGNYRLVVETYKFDSVLGGILMDTPPAIEFSVVATDVSPTANAGGPYSVTTSAQTTTLDGSGSTDPEDCPGGGDCSPVLGYSWQITANGASCTLATPNAVTTTATCTGPLVTESTISLTVTDSVNQSDTATTTVSVISEVEKALRIMQFNADPLAFEIGNPAFSSITVKVKNFGSSNEDVRIKLEVLDPVTNKPMSPPISREASCGVLASLGECTKTLPDFSPFDISSLGSGGYKLAASTWIVGNTSPTTGNLIISDEKSLFFRIGRPVAVPELDLLLLPLIAFSVLAAIFFLGKRKS